MHATAEGRVAIVTGAGQSPGRVASIGEAIARVLARQGGRIVLVDIDSDAADRTRAAIEGEGGQAICVIGDLCDPDTAGHVVAQAEAAFGGIDTLVNNVGIGGGDVVTRFDADRFDRAMAVNVKTAAFMAQAALPRMGAGGAVVNLSTTAIVHPAASLEYSATKSALEALTQHIAFQYGPDGIRANTVRPGEVWTAMVDRHCADEQAAERLRAERAARCVLPYDGDAWDIAELVAFLASPAARWITGQTIAVDGGAPLIRPNPDWKSHHSYWKAPR